MKELRTEITNKQLLASASERAAAAGAVTNEDVIIFLESEIRDLLDKMTRAGEQYIAELDTMEPAFDEDDTVVIVKGKRKLRNMELYFEESED